MVMMIVKTAKKYIKMNCRGSFSSWHPRRSRQTARKKWNLLQIQNPRSPHTHLSSLKICSLRDFFVAKSAVKDGFQGQTFEGIFLSIYIWVWSLDQAGIDEKVDSVSSFQQIHSSRSPTFGKKTFPIQLVEINPPCNGRLLGYSHWSLCIGFSPPVYRAILLLPMTRKRRIERI